MEIGASINRSKVILKFVERFTENCTSLLFHNYFQRV